MNERAGPFGVRVECRHARDGERHERQREEKVRDAPHQREALVVLAARVVRHLGRGDARVMLAFAAVAPFAIEPKRAVRPEEQEHPGDQQHHELGRVPHGRVPLAVVRVGVRLEGDEALRRVRVALLAGGEAVVRVHRRGGIRHALYVVLAVAVEAHRGVRVAERGDLPVVGVAIGAEVLDVAATAALPDDGKLAGIPGRARRAFVRDPRDVLVAVEAGARGVHARRELRRVDVRRESLLPVAREADGVLRIGFLRLHGRDQCRQQGGEGKHFHEPAPLGAVLIVQLRYRFDRRQR
jgi:hypothetical protein